MKQSRQRKVYDFLKPVWDDPCQYPKSNLSNEKVLKPSPWFLGKEHLLTLVFTGCLQSKHINSPLLELCFSKESCFPWLSVWAGALGWDHSPGLTLSWAQWPFLVLYKHWLLLVAFRKQLCPSFYAFLLIQQL